MKQYLAIQHNTDGRPCAWGLASTSAHATQLAAAEWVDHHCYAGERLGKQVVHVIDDTLADHTLGE